MSSELYVCSVLGRILSDLQNFSINSVADSVLFEGLIAFALNHMESTDAHALSTFFLSRWYLYINTLIFDAFDLSIEFNAFLYINLFVVGCLLAFSCLWGWYELVEAT